MSQSRLILGLVSIVLQAACVESSKPSITNVEDQAQVQQILSPDVNYFRANFSDRKVRLTRERSVRARITGAGQVEEYVAAGTKLLALVDNQCAANKSESTTSVSSDLYITQAHEFLNVQAYELEIENTTTVDRLSQMADNDECVYGITEIHEYQLAAVPNDPFYTSQPHHNTTYLNSASAWDWFYHPVKGIKQDVIIAVVDTGIRRTHQDLNGNIYTNANGENGFDFINNDADPTDDNQHGSHVAGLIGAVSNNALGGSGVMGIRAKLMGVKVLAANGSGSNLSVTNGINYAVQNGARVINMSLGASAGPDQILDPAYQSALQNAVANGVTVVVAAGNNSSNLDVSSSYPANQGKNFAGLITVGSLDTVSNTRSSFSNYSSTRVEIFAPGCENSNASPLTGIFSLHNSADNAYTRLCGTSMATPIVSGAAALVIGMLRSNNINPTAAQVEALITGSAPNNPNLNGLAVGGKTLNLLKLAEGLANQYSGADPRKVAITTQPVGSTVNEGANVTLSVAVDTFPAPQIQWTKNNVAIAGATGLQLTLNNVGPDQLADYRAMVGNGYTSVTSSPAKLNVLYRPRVVSQTASSVVGIFGQSQTLLVTSIANPAATFQWYKNGVLVPGQTNANILFTALDWMHQGTYTLKITNTMGSQDSAPINLTLAPIPQPIDGGIERPAVTAVSGGAP